MPVIRFPKVVSCPPTRSDVESDHALTWTRQPNERRPIHITVVGKGSAVSSAAAAIEASVAAAMADKIQPRYVPHTSAGSVVRLRDYQIEAIEALHRSWERGNNAPLIVLPTGAGKTILAAEVMNDAFVKQGHRSLFLAHRKELIDQTAEKVRLVGRDRCVGVVQASKNKLDKEITVASIQTIGHHSRRRLDEVIAAGPYHVLVLDEAHHAVSAQWMRVIDALREAFPAIRIFGMTATPGRADGIALDTVFDDVAYSKSLFDLVDLGYLVPPRAFRVRLDINLDSVERRNGDFVTSQLSKLLNKPRVNETVVESWMEYGQDRRTVAFAVDIEHGSALAQTFSDAGYDCAVLHSKLPAKERSAILRDFRGGKTKILVNVEILTEGFDEPSVEAILFARPTQSQALYIQCIGRGLRPFPGKSDCLVIDCVGNSEEHQLMQLASLAGFDPITGAPLSSGGDDEEGPDADDDEEVVVNTAAFSGEEVDVRRGPRVTRYVWRETNIGWVLNIPRIGYYLVGWTNTQRTLCDVKFFDQRPGRRDSAPRSVLFEPVTFDLAYGLVESEMDRIFRARERRDEFGRSRPEFDDRGDEAPEMSFLDLDEGIDEDITIPEEAMLHDAVWRSLRTSARQRARLISLGVSERSVPETMGEASDLISVMTVARDAKMRMPATQKQRAYLFRWKISFEPNITKAEARRLIYLHRKETTG